MSEDGPTFMVSEETHKALQDELSFEDQEERGRPVRLALVHFNEAEARMMWANMKAAREELEEGEWEGYEDPVHSDEDLSMERLGRFAELQSARRGFPMTSKELGVPVAEGVGSLKERAKLYE